MHRPFTPSCSNFYIPSWKRIGLGGALGASGRGMRRTRVVSELGPMSLENPRVQLEKGVPYKDVTPGPPNIYSETADDS